MANHKHEYTLIAGPLDYLHYKLKVLLYMMMIPSFPTPSTEYIFLDRIFLKNYWESIPSKFLD